MGSKLNQPICQRDADILDAIDDALMVVDPQWTLIYANRAAQEFGAPPIGAALPAEALAADAPPECGDAVGRGARTAFEHWDEARGRRTEVRLFPSASGFVIMERDLEGERRAFLDESTQSEILRLNASLEERVSERTRELEAANREMEGFTYSVSHDLRAPLRAIISTSMIVMEEAGEQLTPELQQLLARQAAAARKMGVLIDDLLKLSRIARQAMRVQRVDLSVLAREVADELVADGCPDCFEIEAGLVARGDPLLLRFVLLNLMENACKFSPNGGTVTVGRVGKDFFVRDEGIGFDMAYANKLFLPFERLVNDDEYPGTGIGLANAQRIIQRHGGQIWAESRPGQGATFSFTLPDSSAQPA